MTVVKTCHILDRGSNSLGADRIDLFESKAKKAIACTLGKLSRELRGQLDSLMLDTKSTQRDVVGANDSWAVEPPPYLIFQELPETLLKGPDFLASSMLCSPRAALVFKSSSVDHNCT